METYAEEVKMGAKLNEVEKKLSLGYIEELVYKCDCECQRK